MIRSQIIHGTTAISAVMLILITPSYAQDTSNEQRMIDHCRQRHSHAGTRPAVWPDRRRGRGGGHREADVTCGQGQPCRRPNVNPRFALRSVRRAEAVKAYLVTKGIEKNRVYTEGKGEKQPVADNKTKEGRAKNRRVEIEVVGTRAN